MLISGSSREKSRMEDCIAEKTNLQSQLLDQQQTLAELRESNRDLEKKLLLKQQALYDINNASQVSVTHDL